MFAHISIGISDIKRSLAFYDPVLKTIGYERLFGNEEEGFMAYGPEESFFIINTPLDPERGEVTATNRTHICFKAESRDAVDQFYKKALSMDAKCAGKPGLRKEYSPTYYAGFIYDLDGHKIEAMYS